MTKCDIILQEVKMSELLEKYGINPFRNRQYRCVFHSPDRHPSAVISKDDKWWHCWSCGANYNVIDFVAEKEKCNRSTSIKIISDMFYLDLDGKLTAEQKNELERKKQAEQKRKQREIEIERFAQSQRHKITENIAFWQRVQNNNHPTRGEIKKNEWSETSQILFFESLKHQHWLEWLYWRICGREPFGAYCEFDYIYGKDRLDILRKLYKGEIKAF